MCQSKKKEEPTISQPRRHQRLHDPETPRPPAALPRHRRRRDIQPYRHVAQRRRRRVEEVGLDLGVRWIIPCPQPSSAPSHAVGGEGTEELTILNPLPQPHTHPPTQPHNPPRIPIPHKIRLLGAVHERVGHDTLPFFLAIPIPCNGNQPPREVRLVQIREQTQRKLVPQRDRDGASGVVQEGRAGEAEEGGEAGEEEGEVAEAGEGGYEGGRGGGGEVGYVEGDVEGPEGLGEGEGGRGRGGHCWGRGRLCGGLAVGSRLVVFWTAGLRCVGAGWWGVVDWTGLDGWWSVVVVR